MSGEGVIMRRITQPLSARKRRSQRQASRAADICFRPGNSSPRKKTAYNQRWHAESGFSQHKRRLGSALAARANASQARELVLRALTHNFMLLADAA